MSMKLFFSILFLCFTFTSIQSQNFEEVDRIVSQYPKSAASPDQLAEQIAKDFSTDIERIRALYTWLALNISYDLETLYSGETAVNFSYTDQQDLQRKLRAINRNMVNNTLRTKKAICEGYAQTFKYISELLGVPCMLVGGYSKGTVDDIGEIPPRENHAWNAVKLNKKWFLIDVTWGAGYANGKSWTQRFNDFYFLTNPDDLILSHYPMDDMWTLTKNNTTLSEFFEKPIFDKAFFINELTLYAPLHGELTLKPNSTIEFTLGEIPDEVSLYYAFRGNTNVEKIIPECADSKCKFSIPFTKNENTSLLLFANQQTALQYKIKLEK